MGVYMGRRRRKYFLAEKKRKHHPVYTLKTFKPQQLKTSTPVKSQGKRIYSGSSGKRFTSPSFKRARFFSPILKSSSGRKYSSSSRKSLTFGNDNALLTDQVIERSDLHKDGESVLNEVETDNDFLLEITSTEEQNDRIEDTYLYEDGKPRSNDSEIDNTTPLETNIRSEEGDGLQSNDDIHKIIDEVLNIFAKDNVKEEFVTFLKLVSLNKFPLNNVAFLLFLDAVKWFDSNDTRAVRYSDTSLKFFWLGKRLFGGKFLRFMGGPKHETSILLGNSQLSPSDSKINFACPSEHSLRNYNPLGCDIPDIDPGVITTMIDHTVKQTNESLSYVIMFDGKKIRRGADVDLLGHETEPLSEKKAKYDADLKEVEYAVTKIEFIIKDIESGNEIDLESKNELNRAVHECFKIFSQYLMEMRKLRKTKELAMLKYKEKIERDATLAKTLEYAIDSCRTTTYQIDNCVTGLLNIQWEVCKSGAFLNGVLELFPNDKQNVCLTDQPNVKLIRTDNTDTEDVPTNQVKQRSNEWFEARSKMKVTGSAIYAAVGCDGLKRLNEHFDKVISNIQKPSPNESQEKAMRHGTESEVHEIATLSSVVMPFLFPNLVYFEEGYYVENDIMVSPDGSLRDAAAMTTAYAFEGKAPSGSLWSRQQYKIPERYITQTVFEQKVMNAESGTIYLCWTPESTTVFSVPRNDVIHSKCLDIIENVYMAEVPRRPNRVPKDTKGVKDEITKHVKQCEFLGEFPSVRAGEVHIRSNTDREGTQFSYPDLMKAFLQAKKMLKEAYDLKRTFASQVLVYLLADLDRMWKQELPHAVPVMYCYRGYSMTMDIARKLLNQVIRACSDKGLHIAAVSSDGEFIQLMVKGQKGQPLTMYQLSKVVWSDVCKMKKNELVNALKSINTEHKVVRDDSNKVFVERADNGCNENMFKRRRTKRMVQKSTITPEEKEPEIAIDMDETMPYDFDELLREQQRKKENEHASFPRMINDDEARDILHLFLVRKRSKWETMQPQDIIEKVSTSLKSLLKDELLDMAKYLNLKLKGTELELNVKSVTKVVLLEQLSELFELNLVVKQPKKRTKITQPKTLRDLCVLALKKRQYPKQALNVAYASYIWSDKVTAWKQNGKVAQTVTIKGNNDELSFLPFYVPEQNEDDGEFRVFTYDKTHLGTNMRKCLCLNKVWGISIEAWKSVSKANPSVLHPSIVEVSDEGKIIDQMKEKLARTMVSENVETEMINMGLEKEAEFCRIFREGLYIADDTPGIPAFERCRKRLALIEWLGRGVDFGVFPPYTGYIKGLSHILYEGLRTSQEAKIYLYLIAKSGSFCVRAPNTLCSESFFGTMQDMDPWGTGILSADGVKKHLSDFTVITSMKMDGSSNIHIQTKRDAAYPIPKVVSDGDDEVTSENNETVNECRCREDRFIRCVVPKDHFFDSAERARLYKGERLYRPNMETGSLRGEQPIRSQYGYKINEAKMLPSKRLVLDDVLYDPHLDDYLT